MLLIEVERAKAVHQLRFVRAELVNLRAFDAAAVGRVADDEIDGCIEIICHALEHRDFRLDVVVFIFVDGGLTDLNRVGERLLADVIFLAEQFQIGKHVRHLFIHDEHFNNQRELCKNPKPAKL